MHLLTTKKQGLIEDNEAIELNQKPADIVFLSCADTEIACLAGAYKTLYHDQFPTLRLASILQLKHPYSIDHYIDTIIQHAKIIVIRLLGGKNYWPYGIERIHYICSIKNIKIILLPGDDVFDQELIDLSNISLDIYKDLWNYCIHGNLYNMKNFLYYCVSLIGYQYTWQKAVKLAKVGLYRPDIEDLKINNLHEHQFFQKNKAFVPVIFYRALIQSNNLEVIHKIIEELEKKGIIALPIYVTTLKDPEIIDTIEEYFSLYPPSFILNMTAFSISKPGHDFCARPFSNFKCPVFQLITASTDEEKWLAQANGLSPRDVAMYVALPEIDGRILTRAVSFKIQKYYDDLTQCYITLYKPIINRIQFIGQIVEGWLKLKNTSNENKRLALILANYPNKDGRLANGVGLDTPESVIVLLKVLKEEGYNLDILSLTNKDLMDLILAGPTNNHKKLNDIHVSVKLSMEKYLFFFSQLSFKVQKMITDKWGHPHKDPFVKHDFFELPIYLLNNIAIGIQPARGYNIDPVKTYHDPDLSPPHGYVAFYAWLRFEFGVHAIVHMGKHGNLEWLPGKALALSEDCFPEAIMGPIPHFYPFIVNDPGEGSQAKRRTAAVIIDHLTPPLTQADSYGILNQLENLIDEYYQASEIDPKRCAYLEKKIFEFVQSHNIYQECNIDIHDTNQKSLEKIDNYLCELKEMQIRNGLHILGTYPSSDKLVDFIFALVKLPRQKGIDQDQSILRALACDLKILPTVFDPLKVDFKKPWQEEKNNVLQNLTEASWRTHGDTLERLEILAKKIITKKHEMLPDWDMTKKVLAYIDHQLLPKIQQSIKLEIGNLIKGLNGYFVEPGPSGAPTRGRLDVLPTGRNFYSVDTRSVPTPTAWALGWESANLILEKHRQIHGSWPKNLALSIWGTSNMRTGGEDIAQILALLGVKPNWEEGSGRVDGFEILPLTVLDRPRVDITIRISGFFRDAFPAQVELLDQAIQAVASLEEPDNDNPLKAMVHQHKMELIKNGYSEDIAIRKSTYRIFGSKPGAYGAGLQALIDERGWRDRSDLAKAYVAWGGYAYGIKTQGTAEHQIFEKRISHLDAILHNQDNREHDILDSDDYYQFEGGLASAVYHLKGKDIPIWHNDHSQPENLQIRNLQDEISKVVRARVVNPKWIKSVMQHGYKGAAEIAATVDYLFAFAATTNCVNHYHFDLVYDAYICQQEVLDFLIEKNINAAQEIAERLIEAQVRGLWHAKSNSTYEHLQSLVKGKIDERYN
ncbi:MAG: cobaltochelatase subunit CobN [Alphaproteobacteria bacterium]|nr:cobaltochelatase subunit CobN [Alphaproteobacteria bacterium]